MSETFNLITSREINEDEVKRFLADLGYVQSFVATENIKSQYRLVEGDSQIEVVFYQDYFDDPFLDIEDSEELEKIEQITKILGGKPSATLAIDYNSGASTESLYFKLALEFSKKWKCVFVTSRKIYNYEDILKRYKSIEQ